jgi:hypothetical protein
VIANLYRPDKQVFQQARSRVLLDGHFEKGLADLIWKALKRWESSGDSEIEDFDSVLYNFGSAGNDVSSISKPVIGKPTYEGQNAQLIVSHNVVCAPPNCAKRSVQKETIVFQLASNAPGWKITDIKYDGGKTSLRDIYSKDVKRQR